MWLMRQSKDRNLPFYYNTETCRSQWSCPQDFIPPIELPICRKRLHFSFVNDDGQEEIERSYYKITTNANRCFYWNRKTGKKSWKLPAKLEKFIQFDSSLHSREERSVDEKPFQKETIRLSFRESKAIFEDYVQNELQRSKELNNSRSCTSVKWTKLTPWEDANTECQQFGKKAKLALNESQMRKIFNSVLANWRS